MKVRSSRVVSGIRIVLTRPEAEGTVPGLLEAFPGLASAHGEFLTLAEAIREDLEAKRVGLREARAGSLPLTKR
jgi:hypothetical protein